MAVDRYNIGIQMKQEDLTKTFMMILNWENPLIPMVHIIKFQRFKG